jgi:D-Ala-D-Ala carboxypeptidase 3 (S13) family
VARRRSPLGYLLPGPKPFSERETRLARNLILRIRPRATIWFHQHLNLVWAWGPSTAAGRTYARAAGMRFYHHPWLAGTASNWQNHHLPGSVSFTVELPAGSLTPQQVRRQVHALLALGTTLRGPAQATRRRADRVRWARWASRASRLIRGLPMSVSVAERGRLVYAHEGEVPRPPASNEKLLLSMALLDGFGARYRIPTTVEGPSPAHGVVLGNLWLVGHGDPELDETGLERLASKLRASGLRAVRGSVIGVTSTFTRERWAPGWRPVALQFIAPPTALVFDENMTSSGFVLNRAAGRRQALRRPARARRPRARPAKKRSRPAGGAAHPRESSVGSAHRHPAATEPRLAQPRRRSPDKDPRRLRLRSTRLDCQRRASDPIVGAPPRRQRHRA